MEARNENEIAVSIPLEDVEKIEIYLNKSRKALSTIISETGAAYAINGTLYKMSNGKPVCPLKSNGVTLYQGRYTYRGYVWGNSYPQSFHFGIVPNETWSNYIACTHIVMDGKAVKKPVYNIAQGGKRGRAAIGTKIVNGQRRICLYASKDKTSAQRTPEQLAQLLAGYGWKDAVMLDGGGSSQAYFYNERRQVRSNRKVPHVILIYMKKGK